MQIILFYILIGLACLSYYCGITNLDYAANSKSAIHEIGGLIKYLIAAVFFTGAMIIGAIIETKPKLKQD